MSDSQGYDGKKLPLVVHLGFGGSRQLVDCQTHPGLDPRVFEASLQQQLTERLRQIPADLGLVGGRHFLCGISQVAIGSDTLFSRSLQELSWLQRVYLPQTPDVFLAATDSRGQPDFTPEQKSEAEQLLISEGVIQIRVASEAADRQTRFADVNREIARLSDVVVCLLREDAADRPGGTQDLLQRSRARGKPVLELRVHVVDGQPQLAEQWHGREAFVRPELEGPLREAAGAVCEGSSPSTLDVQSYCQTLKSLGSRQATKLRDLFKIAALLIHGTHLGATVLALAALLSHGVRIVPLLLAIELVFLLIGFCVHWLMHHSRASHRWAVWRLAAELARSVLALRGRRAALDYLFTLPFPVEMRPLLRTVNVLHLSCSRHSPGQGTPTAQDLNMARGRYLDERLGSPRGQREYYRANGERAEFWLQLSHAAFWIGSGGAILLTAIKLLILLHIVPVDPVDEPLAANLLGGLAVLLPLAAVAALTLSAGLDMEARASIYPEMERFLQAQWRLIERAVDEPEFDRLLLETESRLLGETVNWYARRAYLN